MASESKLGRNAACPCGSGKKFKQCCLGKAPDVHARSRLGWSLLVVLLGCVGAAVLWNSKGAGTGLSAIAASVIVATALYIFRDPNPPRSGGTGDASAINFGG
jgi:hypothetical protein